MVDISYAFEAERLQLGSQQSCSLDDAISKDTMKWVGDENPAAKLMRKSIFSRRGKFVLTQA